MLGFMRFLELKGSSGYGEEAVCPNIHIRLFDIWKPHALFSLNGSDLTEFTVSA